LRNGKGWQRIPEIARLLSHEGIQVVMHIGNPWILDKRRHHAMRRAIRAANIEILPGHLSDLELSQLLSEVDVVILPYRPESYRLRGSGVGLDSIAHGVPLVVSAGCALGEFVANGNGLEAETDDDFVTAIVKIRDNYPSYLANAEHMQRASAEWLTDSPLLKRIAGDF